METFRAFGPMHVVTLSVIALLAAAAVMAGRRAGVAGSPPRPLERAVGWAYLSAWVVTYAWLLFPPLHDPSRTYPFQLCHLCALAAALRLLTGWRPLCAIVHFWGLALCTQALITPALGEGPALYPFWFFWSTHGLIVGVAVYDLGARAYAPTRADYALACAAAALYVAVVLPVNLVFGWNYGFVGPSTPEVRTIVDFLGPWPLRLLPMFAIVAAAMALLLAPWEFARARSQRTAPAG